MKKLGLLFGHELWLDTNSEHIAQQAKNTIEKVFTLYYAAKTDKELENEVAAALPKRPYETD